MPEREAEVATFVLVHGGWAGGWIWAGVARELRAAGHEVFAPTLTGLGERVHLASPDIDLETHVLDVVNVLRYERLEGVVLVGHSYGGMVVTGVAERVPERIARLVYLDALVPNDGESVADLVGPEAASQWGGFAAVAGDGWRIPPAPDWDNADRNVPQPMRPMLSPLALRNPEAQSLERAFVHFTGSAPDDWSRPIFEGMAARLRHDGRDVREVPFEHQPFVDRPTEVARLLLGYA